MEQDKKSREREEPGASVVASERKERPMMMLAEITLCLKHVMHNCFPRLKKMSPRSLSLSVLYRVVSTFNELPRRSGRKLEETVYSGTGITIGQKTSE